MILTGKVLEYKEGLLKLDEKFKDEFPEIANHELTEDEQVVWVTFDHFFRIDARFREYITGAINIFAITRTFMREGEDDNNNLRGTH